MTSRDFCYWLQGFFEITDAKEITEAQTQIIKNHLSMVFVHEIDPSFGEKEHQDKLNALHSGEPYNNLGKLRPGKEGVMRC